MDDHVMVDLETLGVQSDSAFISIGACRFNPYSGLDTNYFLMNIDWDDAVSRRSVNGSTLKWWIAQGTAHNALDDAVHQAKVVSKLWRKLRSK